MRSTRAAHTKTAASGALRGLQRKLVAGFTNIPARIRVIASEGERLASPGRSNRTGRVNERSAPSAKTIMVLHCHVGGGREPPRRGGPRWPSSSSAEAGQALEGRAEEGRHVACRSSCDGHRRHRSVAGVRHDYVAHPVLDCPQAPQLSGCGSPARVSPDPGRCFELQGVERGRVYTFTIRPGFRFSNGTPVKAANYAFAINRALGKDLQSPAFQFIADANATEHRRCPGCP